MDTLDRIDRLKSLATSEKKGDAASHHALLKELRLLQQEIETPIETTSRLNFQILQNLCLRLAVEKGLLHAIVAHDGEAIEASKLAKTTRVDVLLITRVMRVLSAINVVTETGENTYTANSVTRHQVTPGAIGALKHHFDLDMTMSGSLVDYMRREPDNAIYQFAGEPEGNQTLFDFAHGHPTIFGLLSSDTDRGREQKQSFDDYMAAKRPPTSMQQWFEIYPIAEDVSSADSPEVLIVDVGGGPGQEVIGLKARYPSLPGRCIVQDLPITLDRIGDLPDGVEKQPYDFFTPQPVWGARLYFMRDIMHNWSDVKCTQILSRIRDAMDKERSTLLIDQYVLPTTGAELRAAEMDILMLLHTSGMQRTESMWKSLLEGAGLRLVRIWSGDSGAESVLEVEKI